MRWTEAKRDSNPFFESGARTAGRPPAVSRERLSPQLALMAVSTFF
jgi:hypothetical protein